VTSPLIRGRVHIYIFGKSSQNRFLVKSKTSLSGSGQGGSGQGSQAKIVFFFVKSKTSLSGSGQGGSGQGSQAKIVFFVNLCQGLAREGLARAVKPKSFFWLKAKRLCQGLAREGLARAVKPKNASSTWASHAAKDILPIGVIKVYSDLCK
jgi:hypothetical protein